MFESIKAADVRTVGNLAAAGGVALGVYEIFGASRPSYLWPGLLVGAGVAAHLITMDQKSVTALGQAPGGAAAAASTTCQAKDLGQQREREAQVKALPYVIGGAVALLALKILL